MRYEFFFAIIMKKQETENRRIFLLKLKAKYDEIFLRCLQSNFLGHKVRKNYTFLFTHPNECVL